MYKIAYFIYSIYQANGVFKKDVFFKKQSNFFRNCDLKKMNDSNLFLPTIECTTYM